MKPMLSRQFSPIRVVVAVIAAVIAVPAFAAVDLSFNADPSSLTGSSDAVGYSAIYSNVGTTDGTPSGTAIDLHVTITDRTNYAAGGGRNVIFGWSGNTGIGGSLNNVQPGSLDDLSVFFPNSTQGTSVTLQFAYFESGTSNPLSLESLFTTFDVDHNVGERRENVQFAKAIGKSLTYETGTNLEIIDQGGDMLIRGTQAENFTNPSSVGAFTLATKELSSFEITLFLDEVSPGDTTGPGWLVDFSNPPNLVTYTNAETTVIPSPAGVFMIGAAVVSLLCPTRRKRQRA